MIHRHTFLLGGVLGLAATTGCLDLNSKDNGVDRSSQALTGAIRNEKKFSNPHGFHATLSTQGGAYLDTSNPFFQSLSPSGNGRACVTCHEAESGFSVSAARIQARFDATDGEDPIFRTNDGSNSPTMPTGTVEEKRAAYSLLLSKGLIRLRIPITEFRQTLDSSGKPVPSTTPREFDIYTAYDDPWGNPLTPGADPQYATDVVVFRRPLQSTNLRFVQTIMFDGREPDLISQAKNATRGHAEIDPDTLDPSVFTSIVNFETSLFTTQVQNFNVGVTSAAGATGDPFTLSQKTFTHNENRNPSTNGGIGVFDTNVFRTFDAWANNTGDKAAVYRGQVLFNTKQFVVDSKTGFVTCANCHDHPQSGVFTGKMFPFENIGPFGGFGTVQTSAAAFRTPDLPLYKVRNRATGAITYTSDPGMALVTGRFNDISRIKSPPLRGLAAHGPYFHNGMSATLADLVDHYNLVFNIGLTEDEKSDMTVFLGSL